VSDDTQHDPVDELLATAYAVDGPEANRALYARWADTYERGFIVDSRYVYHEHVAEVFVERAGPSIAVSGPVLDVGCGTGVAGEALRRRGVHTIDGVDISPEMLERARSKHDDAGPVYRSLIEADLTEPLAIDADVYSGVVSVGTFTHGHVGPAALAELVRITRPGGRVAIGINAAHFSNHGFASMLARLCTDRRITEPELIAVPIYEGSDMSDPDQFAHVVVFEVLG